MKNILVTGVSRGIGKSTVECLKAMGCHVIAVSRGSEPAFRDLETSASGRIDFISTDITTTKGRDVLMSELQRMEVFQLDGLINNAGLLINKPFEEILEDELEYIYKVNVFAPFHLNQRCLNLLKNSDSSHVVNISSMGGIMGSAKFPGLSGYSSSKGALSILTECLAEELKESTVSVNALALGAVQTEMLEEAFPGYKAPVSPEEMGNFIAEFVCNGHKFQNGKIVSLSLSTP